MSLGHYGESTRPVNSENTEFPPVAPFAATVDDLVEMLTRCQPKFTRLIVEVFRHLWEAGQLKELAKLYKAVHKKFLEAVKASLPAVYDHEDKIHNREVCNAARKRIYDLLSRATSGNGKVLQPYRRETVPLTDTERKHFGQLWTATEKRLRMRARRLNPADEDDLLSDTVARLVKSEVFASLAPEYDRDHFLQLAFKCMRMAHRKHREIKRRQREVVGRYHLRKGKAVAAENARSKVVEFVERMESLSILLHHIGQLRTDRRRDALVSFYLDFETVEEIAERWGAKHKAVWHSCSRGVQELRAVIPKSLDPGGYTSEQATARMAKLRDRGETWSSIGERFGIQGRAVVLRVSKIPKTDD